MALFLELCIIADMVLPRVITIILCLSKFYISYCLCSHTLSVAFAWQFLISRNALDYYILSKYWQNSMTNFEFITLLFWTLSPCSPFPNWSQASSGLGSTPHETASFLDGLSCWLLPLYCIIKLTPEVYSSGWCCRQLQLVYAYI